MTRIDFYILPNQSSDARLRYACGLAYKAWQHNRQVYLHCSSEEEAEGLDDLLWSFRADAYLPHALYGAHGNEPVICGWGSDPEPFHDVLINLTDETPAFFSRFNRLAEILIESEPVIAAGRARYRFYRDRGYPLDSHHTDSRMKHEATRAKGQQRLAAGPGNHPHSAG